MEQEWEGGLEGEIEESQWREGKRQNWIRWWGEQWMECSMEGWRARTEEGKKVRGRDEGMQNGKRNVRDKGWNAARK